jgi:flagellar motor protein MotB
MIIASYPILLKSNISTSLYIDGLAIVVFLSYSTGDLLIFLIVAAALGIVSVTANPAYGQHSDIRTSLIPSANNATSQHQISDGGQQLIAIPSLSSNDLDPGKQQSGIKDNDREQSQGLEPAVEQTIADTIEEQKEQEGNRIIRNVPTQRETQQQGEEGKAKEIQAQQREDEQIKEKLEDAEVKTDETIEEGRAEREEENIDQNGYNDGEKKREDSSDVKNNGVTIIELPFP